MAMMWWVAPVVGVCLIAIIFGAVADRLSLHGPRLITIGRDGLHIHTRTRSWNLGMRAFVKFLVAVFGVLVVWAAGTFLLLLFDSHVIDSAPAGTTKTSAYLVSLIACAVFVSGLLLCGEYLIRHPKQPPESYATEGRPNAND
jgi:hypothetical protein